MLPLLHYSHVAKVFRTAFRSRPNSGRAVIIMLSIGMVIAQATMSKRIILVMLLLPLLM